MIVICILPPWKRGGFLLKKTARGGRAVSVIGSGIRTNPYPARSWGKEKTTVAKR